MTNNNRTNTRQDALAAIRSQKQDVHLRIQKSSEIMRTMTHDLFTPPKATSKLEQAFNLFDQGIAIYDGVMLGMRFVRNIRHIFGKK